MTTDEMNLRNHWMMFGEAACVTKLGDGKWHIWNGCFGFPVFPTKREAAAAVTAFVVEIGRRRFENVGEAGQVPTSTNST